MGRQWADRLAGAAGVLAFAGYARIAVGRRTRVHEAQTGTSGHVGPDWSKATDDERRAWYVHGLGTLLVAAGPLLQAIGVVRPMPGLRSGRTQVAGLALAGLAVAGTYRSQLAMGKSWRIGVDTDERTDLVTNGPFGVVRNPIYSCLLAYGLGSAALTPNPVSVAGVVLSAVGLEQQVRLLEEPYLLELHGDAYLSWSARTGRFVPFVGRRPSCAAVTSTEAGGSPDRTAVLVTQ
jgi:protein-S-isoprenylcysteine O-methyltransferase Ste14